MGNQSSTSLNGGQGNRCGMIKNNRDLTGTNTVCENWLNMYKFIMRSTLPPGPQAEPKLAEELLGSGAGAAAAGLLPEVSVGVAIAGGIELGKYFDNIEYPDDWKTMPLCKDNPKLIPDETCCETADKCKQKYPPGWSAKSVQFQENILCPYPDNLFNLWRSDCLDSKNGYLQTYIDNPSKESFLKAFNNTKNSVTPETFWNKDRSKSNIDCGNNPYKCAHNVVNAVTNEGHDDYGYACRWLNPTGEYCRTEPFSLTANRRAAAWGCGIGGLIGLSNVGVCNQNYNFEGLSDWIDDINRILPEFESLTFLCLGTHISAVQCKMLENFATQDVVYKTLVLEKEKLLQKKLEQPILVSVATLAIIIIILIFLSMIRIYT